MIDYKIGNVRLESNTDGPGEYVNLKGPIKLRASKEFFDNVICIDETVDYYKNWREYGVGIRKDLKYFLYFEDGFCIVEVMPS